MKKPANFRLRAFESWLPDLDSDQGPAAGGLTDHFPTHSYAKLHDFSPKFNRPKSLRRVHAIAFLSTSETGIGLALSSAMVNFDWCVKAHTAKAGLPLLFFNILDSL